MARNPRLERTRVPTVGDSVSVVVEIGTAVFVVEVVAVLRVVDAAVEGVWHAVQIGVRLVWK